MNLKDAELAQALLDYQRKWDELKELESLIVRGVLELGESQKVARVVATYYNPKHVVDYEAAAKDYQEKTRRDLHSIIDEYSTTKIIVSWKSVAEFLGLDLSGFTSEEPARVVVKVKD